jgi:hypothetical protein
MWRRRTSCGPHSASPISTIYSVNSSGHAPDILFGGGQANIREPQCEAPSFRLTHGSKRLVAAQSNFNGEALPGLHVLLGTSQDLAPSFDAGLRRRSRIYPSRYSVGVEEILSTWNHKGSRYSALARPVGTRNNREDWHAYAALAVSSRRTSKFLSHGAPGMYRISKRRPSGCSIRSIPV